MSKVGYRGQAEDGELTAECRPDSRRPAVVHVARYGGIAAALAVAAVVSTGHAVATADTGTASGGDTSQASGSDSETREPDRSERQSGEDRDTADEALNHEKDDDEDEDPVDDDADEDDVSRLRRAAADPRSIGSVPMARDYSV
ncbi:hypothetical protein PDG61_19885 [Mycolicibacterium sp. BiH015]|uniref:hypothetical protein n=1 Tax=Mycolicibacterium sp. BiH015 TaxID=3018808 RepID=UPI0022E06FA1|nr:hypothetical protein [Mycolicibacterium sp. BiH015]MDA2893194.1 hypothetical protein [Mycolicibacterium sp. BiH015]